MDIQIKVTISIRYLLFKWECGEKVPSYVAGGAVKWIEHFWKAILNVYEKRKIYMLFDPGIPLLGICEEGAKALTDEDICTRMLLSLLFTKLKTWKQKAMAK